MPKTKDPYKTNRDFLTPPTTALYQEHDVEISDLPWIQDLLEDTAELDSHIDGDFDLNYLKFRIYNNELSFVRTGLIAFKIKALKLYKGVAKSFKTFCEDHLHKTHWMVDRLIRGAKVVIDLIAAGFEILPRNEAQCRALVAGAEDDIVAAWQHVLEQHEEEIHKITAKSIRRCLKGEEDEPKTQTLIVSAMLYAAIWKAAQLKELKPIEYLEELFLGKQNCDNFAHKRKLKKWEEGEIENQDYYESRANST